MQKTYFTSLLSFPLMLWLKAMAFPD